LIGRGDEQPKVGTGEAAHDIGRLIARAVVVDDDLIREALRLEIGYDALKAGANTARLIVGGNGDR
jgi:hypothetical protein